MRNNGYGHIHGLWMVIAGLMFFIGLHGKAWGVYHAIRALLIFLPHK